MLLFMGWKELDVCWLGGGWGVYFPTLSRAGSLPSLSRAEGERRTLLTGRGGERAGGGIWSVFHGSSCHTPPALQTAPSHHPAAGSEGGPVPGLLCTPSRDPAEGGWEWLGTDKPVAGSVLPPTADGISEVCPTSCSILLSHLAPWQTGQPLGFCMALGVASEKSQSPWAPLSCQGRSLACSWVSRASLRVVGESLVQCWAGSLHLPVFRDGGLGTDGLSGLPPSIPGVVASLEEEGHQRSW